MLPTNDNDNLYLLLFFGGIPGFLSLYTSESIFGSANLRVRVHVAIDKGSELGIGSGLGISEAGEASGVLR